MGASGTDYSKQNSSQYSGSDLIIGSSNSVTTTSSHSFISTDVGNIINITTNSGGWTAGRYEIVSVAAGAATLDRSPGTLASTGGAYVVGGALQNISTVQTIWTTSNENNGGQICYVKAEAIISFSSSQSWEPSNTQQTIIGYTTTRGDNGQVTLKWTGASFQCITVQGITIRNFIFNCNSVSGVNTVKVTNSNTVMVNCLCENGSQSGITCSNGNNTFIDCVVTASGGGGNAAITFSSGNGPNVFINCIAYANSAVGFNGQGGTLIGCISAGNTGGTSDGFQVSGGDGPCSLVNCLAYKNGRDGFRWTPTSGVGITPIVQNCIFYGNSGYGMNSVNGQATTLFNQNNAYGANTTANLNQVTAGLNDVALTADPTTNGTSQNFALNSTSGGGAALKAAGFPGALQVGGTGYLDIGPLQSQAAGGSTYVITQHVTLIEQGAH